jgi:hypothetical protein
MALSLVGTDFGWTQDEKGIHCRNDVDWPVLRFAVLAQPEMEKRRSPLVG